MPAPVKTFADYFFFGGNDAASETDPSLRAMPNGRLGLIWSDDSSGTNPEIAFASQIAGTPSMSTTTFLNGATDEFNLTQAFTAGGFRIVAWTQKDDATGDNDIFARILGPTTGATGTQITNPFLINTDAQTGSQIQPQAIAIDEDSFLVAWVDANTARVRGTVVSVDGGVELAPFDISTSNVSQNFEFGLTQLAGGRIVVSYRTGTFDSSFRVLFSNGSPATAEIDFDGVAAGTGATSVAALADGRFAMVVLKGGTIVGRVFDSNGNLSVPEFNILSGGDFPKAIGLPDGRFFVINSASGELFGQMMKADGTKDGGVVAINTVTTGSQTNADMTLLADGRIAIAWQTTENGNNDIKVTILDPRETGVDLAGTALADDYVGSAFEDVIVSGAGNDVVDGAGGNDVIAGGSGNDLLTGGGGADTLRGGSGNDTLNGGTGADGLEGGLGDDSFFVDDASDVVVEASGEGNDRVFASVTYALPGSAAIEILSTDNAVGTAAIALSGNGFADFIFANAGDNALNGLGGDDFLVGLAGNDGLDGGSGADTTDGGTGDDSHFIDSVFDVVIERAGEGSDRVFASTSFALATDAEVEMLTTNDAAGLSAINLRGSDTANFIYGNDGSNGLTGLGGEDFLAARAGNDSLDGGLGNDQLNGGADGDIFLFTTALGATNVDAILDFVSGLDAIGLDDAIFAGLAAGGLAASAFRAGASAQDADDRIIYDAATGALFFDADGNGAGAAIQFATLGAGTTLIASDFVVI